MSDRLEATLAVSVPLHLLALPPREPGPGRVPVLLGLHGYAMTAEGLLPSLRAVAPGSFLVVSLEGPFSTIVPGSDITAAKEMGFHWGATPRFEESRAVHRSAVEAAIGWAVANGGDPGRIYLAGFSQPCSFNYRVAHAPPHGEPFRAVVALCGGVPRRWTEGEKGTEASARTPVLHVSTRSDPFYPLEKARSFHARLVGRFRSVEHRFYDGGHRIPKKALPAVRAFLEANA